MKSSSHQVSKRHIRKLQRLFNRREEIMHILRVYHQGKELPPPSVVARYLNRSDRRPHVSRSTVRRDYVALGFCRAAPSRGKSRRSARPTPRSSRHRRQTMKQAKARAISPESFQRRERVYRRRCYIFGHIRHFGCVVPSVSEMTQHAKEAARFTKTSVTAAMIRRDYKVLRLLPRSLRSH